VPQLEDPIDKWITTMGFSPVVLILDGRIGVSQQWQISMFPDGCFKGFASLDDSFVCSSPYFFL
jgi:hypothetical protein